MKLPVLVVVSLFVFSGSLDAALFPQLASRDPVGDPVAVNPLEDREGPKTLAAGDLNGDGLNDIVTGNLDGSVSVLLSRPGGGMAEQILCGAGGSIRSVVLADANGDGQLDVFAADITKGVSILLGNGDGSLNLFSETPIPDARALAAADLNGDGIQDFFVGCSTADCEHWYSDPKGFLSAFLGNGDGTFRRSWMDHLEPRGCLYDVTLADLDGDSHVDALALDFASSQLLVLGGNGDGTFAPAQALPLGGGARAFSVGYLDERLMDGAPPAGADLDIAVANRDGATLDLFLGRAGLTFSPPVKVASGDSPRSVAAGDLNGDGLAELVVANRNDDSISVLRGLGDGRFASPLQLAAGRSPRELALADLTGDGVLDAAVANRISGDVSTFVGRRGLAGFLVPERYYPAGITPVGVVAADFDEDGRPDAATVNLRSHDVRVRLNVGGGDLGDETIYPVGYQPSSIAAADVDGNGHVDMIVACMGSSAYAGSGGGASLVTLLGRGDGAFDTVTTSVVAEIPFQPYWIRMGDLSGDGVLDAAVSGQKGELALFRGRGDGTFDSQVNLYRASEWGDGIPLALSLGDFDEDGRLDIATSRGTILLSDGRFFEGAWSRETRGFPTTNEEWALEAADLDGDGHLDLIVALPFAHPDPIAVHFGNGDGTFLDSGIYQTGTGVVALQAADMDGDGILDIVCGNRCTADVNILRGIGGRKFEHLETVRAYSVEGIAIADLNGDGRLDLLGAGLALWVVIQGDESRLSDPKQANPAGILPAEGVYINEIMALNRESYIDDRGKTPDWLEIYNHSAESKDLTGWMLRQESRSGVLTDWTLPVGTVIGPKAHLVILCDGDVGDPGLHATFRLDSDGESVSLLAPENFLKDRVDFPATPADVSYARFVDGARYLSYNSVPTMGGANVQPTNLSPSVSVRDPYRTADGSSIGVTARLFDDIGIAYASVNFRLEDSTSFSEVTLADDGAHGDRRAGDGLFGAALPASLPEGATVLYYVRVVDLEGETAAEPDDPSVAANLFRIAVPPRSRSLRISEILVESKATGGQFAGEDWLEISNCGETAQSFDGLALTEDYFTPEGAWRFPAGISLDPGRRLVVVCDGGQGGLHASFRLNRGGGTVLLVQAAEPRHVLDSISFGPLPADTAYGITECDGEPQILAHPTPGEPNDVAEKILFLRGDSNADCGVDISDAVHILTYLFVGGDVPTCLKSADSDDSGVLDLTDAIRMLGFLFRGAMALPEPFPAPGGDLTPDGLSCDAYPPECAR